MKSWTVHEARARFGAVLDACLTDGPQLVTRRGVETAVLVSAAEWQRATAALPDAPDQTAPGAGPARIALVVAARTAVRRRVRVRIA